MGRNGGNFRLAFAYFDGFIWSGEIPVKGEWKLTVDILDCNLEYLPVLKTTINGRSWKYKLPAGSGKNSLESEVVLDDMEISETGRYLFEAPMPAVTSPVKSKFEIWVDGVNIQSGKVERSPQKSITPADYADTKMGTAHSRWMIAPGPWMPFSMVKLSPDNQNAGWQAGYDPIFESIGGFSHIHEWTMAGLLLMPTNGELKTEVGDEKDPDSGYRSRMNKGTEEAPIGYYKAELTDYGILAELTATTRCGFQRYTFPKDKPGSRILIDLQNPAEYGYNLEEVKNILGRFSNSLEYSFDDWTVGQFAKSLGKEQDYHAFNQL